MSKKSRSIGARLREAWNAFVGGGSARDEEQQAGDTINAADAQGPINRPSGPVDQTFGNAGVSGSGTVQGANVGVNQGIIITRIIYGRDPAEAEREQVVRYLSRLAAKMRRLPLRGLADSLAEKGEGLSLPQVYVMLATTTETVMSQGTRDTLQEYFEKKETLKAIYHPTQALPDVAIVRQDYPDATTKSRLIRLSRSLLATEAVRQHQRLVLLGDPGSGKSTFVRHLAWVLAARALDPSTAPSPPHGWDEATHVLPLFLPLRKLAGRIAHEGARPSTVSATLCDEITKEYDTQHAPTLLDRALATGAALLLFDGLDEVPLEDMPKVSADRQTVLKVVREFVSLHANNHVVLTCRVRAFDQTLRDCLGWHVETLAPFTLGQMRHFVPAWYAEMVEKQQISRAQAETMEQTLLDTLQQSERLRDMAQTPLLLTMMALVLYNQNELPRDRPQLYESILKLLLGVWDQVRDGQSLSEALGLRDWSSERIRPLLDRLSYDAHRTADSHDGRGRLERGRIYTALIDFFTAAGVPMPGECAVRCLTYFEQRSGLLMPDGKESYVFAHLTLQEHCAGRALVLAREPVTDVMRHRADDRWREPLFLGLGVVQPTNPWLIESVLRRLINQHEDGHEKPETRWYRDLILAAEIGVDRDWGYLRQQGVDVASLQADLIAGLVELLTDKTQLLPVQERVRAGFLLGDLGDPRCPVTIEAWQREVAKMRADDTSGYFCLLQPGTYTIGSSDDDPDGDDDEKPQHTITLEQPLWVARYPITNAQWQAWVQAGGKQSRFADDSDLNHPNQPVVGVTWHRVNEFCTWLSERVGITLRLPTEFEWEAAARGGDARRYPWGDAWQDDRAATNKDQQTRGWRWSVPVGCYPVGAAPCGALDMAGNVWEWTASEYLPYQQAAGEAKEAEYNVLRGGDYSSIQTNVRCGARNWSPPDSGNDYDDYGFRVFAAPHSEYSR